MVKQKMFRIAQQGWRMIFFPGKRQKLTKSFLSIRVKFAFQVLYVAWVGILRLWHNQ